MEKPALGSWASPARAGAAEILAAPLIRGETVAAASPVFPGRKLPREPIPQARPKDSQVFGYLPQQGQRNADH